MQKSRCQSDTVSTFTWRQCHCKWAPAFFSVAVITEFNLAATISASPWSPATSTAPSAPRTSPQRNECPRPTLRAPGPQATLRNSFSKSRWPSRSSSIEAHPWAMAGPKHFPTAGVSARERAEDLRTHSANNNSANRWHSNGGYAPVGAVRKFPLSSLPMRLPCSCPHDRGSGPA